MKDSTKNELLFIIVIVLTIIITILTTLIVIKSFFNKSSVVYTIYTNNDIYYVKGDSLLSETGDISFKGSPQQISEVLETLTVKDVNSHICIDSTHKTCDGKCICDGMNCEN